MKLVKAGGGEPIGAFGLDVKLMVSGERVMLTLVILKPGESVPRHSHISEQAGICLKGRAEFRSGGRTFLVEEGDCYLIPGKEEHEVLNLGEGEAVFLDVFSPPREEYQRFISSSE